MRYGGPRVAADLQLVTFEPVVEGVTTLLEYPTGSTRRFGGDAYGPVTAANGPVRRWPIGQNLPVTAGLWGTTSRGPPDEG